MKTLGKALKAIALLTICTTLLSANSQARDDAPKRNYTALTSGKSLARDLPEKNYACQVQAKNGIQGLVLVQTDNQKMAFDTASRSTALTMNGKQSETIAVVQCIELPKARFTDSTFQKFFEESPL